MPDQTKLPNGPLSERSVHLCVDMQNLFDEGSPWHTPWMRRVLPVVTRLARHRPERTIFTRFIPPRRPEDATGRWRPYFERWRDLTLERIDPRMIELLEPLAALVPPATVVDKPAYSPFHETLLDDMLRDRGADTLVVSGTETDVCVLSAVLGAIDLGYRVVVPSDAVCGSADETHDALIRVYHSRFSGQVEVTSADVVLASWRR